jgi:outer membrane protein OmpA-like peptidoglycan-associated protein
MRIWGGAWCLALLSVGAVAAAGAQEFGTIEATGFGRFTNLNAATKFDEKIGGGGEIGFFIYDRFSVEGALSVTNSVTNTGAPESYVPLHIRLVYHQPLGSDRLVGLLGGGFTHNFYGRTLSGAEDGGGVLAGVEALATSWFGIRLDATFDYLPGPFQYGGNNNTKFGVQAGLLFRLPHHAEKPPPPTPEPTPVAAAPPPPPPPAPPLDSDHDGVPDSVDACPNTPAGEPVDARGCSASQRDSDGDGVTDDKDKCPNTPPGTKVDSVGCPILFTKPALVLEGVTFAVNKAVLLPQSSATLDRVAQSLDANPGTRVEVRGYTDATGPASVNTRLSQERAEAVRSYLISKGVAPDHITAKGYGPADPVASNATAAGRAQNRRVELRKVE